MPWVTARDVKGSTSRGPQCIHGSASTAHRGGLQLWFGFRFRVKHLYELAPICHHVNPPNHSFHHLRSLAQAWNITMLDRFTCPRQRNRGTAVLSDSSTL